MARPRCSTRIFHWIASFYIVTVVTAYNYIGQEQNSNNNIRMMAPPKVATTTVGTISTNPKPSSSSTTTAATTTTQLHNQDKGVHEQEKETNVQKEQDHQEQKQRSLRVAHLGNSIQYFNDCPRLLEHMFLDSVSHGDYEYYQDSCLRGGATIPSLWKQGNGMQTKFHTPNALVQANDGQTTTESYDIGSPTVADLLTKTTTTRSDQNNNNGWDFVIINDHTQSPTREESKQSTLQVLKDSYLPLLLQQNNNNNNTTVIFLMTAAYRKPVKHSDELGTFDEFTSKLWEGYQTYTKIIPHSKIAPVGLAFQHVRNENHETWETLYARDDFHPSPHGTLLQAMVLYCTMTGEAPPTYNPDWWKTARYMQPRNTKPLPLPTIEEAQYLHKVACHVCQILDTDGDNDKTTTNNTAKENNGKRATQEDNPSPSSSSLPPAKRSRSNL